MNNPTNTENRLRNAFETYAAGIHPAPNAYQNARKTWRRAQQRRRLTLTIIITIVFALAILAGLWVLNHATPTQHTTLTTTATHQQPRYATNISTRNLLEHLGDVA